MQALHRGGHCGQADAVGHVHRPALRSREAVAGQEHEVDVARAQRNAARQQLRALVDHRIEAALQDLVLADRAPGEAQPRRLADQEGFHCIGIEQSAEYLEIARRRLATEAPLFTEVA